MHIDPVTLGLPGALPVLNEQAVELAMRIGAALNCTIQPCTFHRKNYFYPDMPKAYQISQYDQPLNVDGHLELPNGKRIGIERAHMEEDTGKSTHIGGTGGRIHGSEHSLIDFNRAGVPLVEIVSRPDIRSAEEARQYVTELRAILVAIGASDAKMEEGSMRVDANVSVHRPGHAVRDPLRDQERQQRALARPGDRVRDAAPDRPARQRRAGPPGDPPLGRERRSDAHPALQGGRRRLPLLPRAGPGPAGPVGGVDRARPRQRCRCCPAARRARLAEATGVAPDSEAAMVVVDRGQDEYVLAVGAAGGDVGRALIHVKEAFADSPSVPAADLAALTKLEISGTLTATQAKTVLAELVAGGGGDPRRSPRPTASRRWTTARSPRWSTRRSPTTGAVWAKFVGGEGKAMGALVGAVMKASKGQADGKAVTALLNARKG